jgi:uncharacterized protein YbcI
MAYKTIFGIKPKKDNKKEFCKRIVDLLNGIKFCSDGYVYNDGGHMLDIMFKYSHLNNGYSNIDDLLNEAEKPHSNIFKLVDSQNLNVTEEEVLTNIDIIANCLYRFKRTSDRYYYDDDEANEIVGIIFEAIEQYLLSCGYKLALENEQLHIIENEIVIDLNDVSDDKVRKEIISFYDYKNEKDLEEKKKIMLIIIGKLESRKSDIEKIFGAKTADIFSNFANNFNLRHNNVSQGYAKCFNKTISQLSEEEILLWYDYIFTFLMNIYLKLDILKDVNINGGYQ